MRIGENVSIHKDAKLGQVDLLHFEDNVTVDNCTIRPFSIEEVRVLCNNVLHVRSGVFVCW